MYSEHILKEVNKFFCNYTALVRDKRSGIYSIRRTEECNSMKEYAEELRGNGFRVAKIFVGYVSDSEVVRLALL